MITVTEFFDETFEEKFVPLVEESYTKIQDLLDNIPATLNVKFTEGASDITGVGGFTPSNKQINLSIFKDFPETTMQQRNLRTVVFHEAFHIQQNFTFDQSPFTGFEAMIYEGCAVVFEKQYGKGAATYADYADTPRVDLQKWCNELKLVGKEYFEDEDIWHQWAFYHPGYDERWIIYKAGSFLIDQLLAARQLDILDLKNKTAGEIAVMIDELGLLEKQEIN